MRIMTRYVKGMATDLASALIKWLMLLTVVLGATIVLLAFLEAGWQEILANLGGR